MRGAFQPTDARSLAMAVASRKASVERLKLIEARNRGQAGAGAEALMCGAIRCIERLQRETIAWATDQETPRPIDERRVDAFDWRKAG